MPKNYTTLLAEAFRDIEAVMARIEDSLASIRHTDAVNDEDIRSVAQYVRDPRVVEPLIRVRARIIERNAMDGEIDEIYSDLSILQGILDDLQELYKKIRQSKRKK